MEFYALMGFYLLTLVYSIILHEISHGVAALWLGDRTAKDAGVCRLILSRTWNHCGSLVLPAVMIYFSGFAFGWAKPVPYNPLNLAWKKWGPVAVAFAGPLTNYILAITAAIIGKFMPVEAALKSDIISALMGRITESNLHNIVAGDFSAIIFALLCMIIFWNVLLGTFNLLPIPPLDGSKLLFLLFPVSPRVEKFMNDFGMIILLVFIFSPLAIPFHMALNALWFALFGFMM